MQFMFPDLLMVVGGGEEAFYSFAFVTLHAQPGVFSMHACIRGLP